MDVPDVFVRQHDVGGAGVLQLGLPQLDSAVEQEDVEAIVFPHVVQNDLHGVLSEGHACVTICQSG